jgi:uncharacterized protein YuzE
MLFLIGTSRRFKMQIKYFSDTDTAIIEFTDRPITETRELSENIYMDFDADGNPVNLTVEHARKTARLPNLSYEQIDKVIAGNP